MPSRKTPTLNGTPDAPPKRRAPTKTATKPLKYSKAVVEALLKMIEGAAMLLPSVRNQPVTEQEHQWLVDDWYEFGLGNTLFQKLVLSCFSNSVYVRLTASHIAVFGARMIGYEQERLAQMNAKRVNAGMEPVGSSLPLNQLALVVNAAYIARLASESQEEIIATLQAQEEEEESVDAGPARDGGWQDGIGEDFLSPLSAQAPRPRRYAGDER